MTMVSEVDLHIGLNAGAESQLTPPAVMTTEAITPFAVESPALPLTEPASLEVTPEEASAMTGVPVLCEGYGGKMIRRTTVQILAMAAFRDNGCSPVEPTSFMGRQVRNNYLHQAGLRQQAAERHAQQRATSQESPDDQIGE